MLKIKFMYQEQTGPWRHSDRLAAVVDAGLDLLEDRR